MKPVDEVEIARPVRNVRDDHQVDQNGQELVCCQDLAPFPLPLPCTLEAGYSVAEAVELLQRSRELVELGQDC